MRLCLFNTLVSVSASLSCCRVTFNSGYLGALGRKRRSSPPDHFAAHEMKRYQILGAMEGALRENLGIDGHACVLRMLCETAQVGNGPKS